MDMEYFDNLIEQARAEKPPVIDISSRVLMNIQSRPKVFRDMPLSLFAAASVVAALVILSFAVNCWMTASDPQLELFAPLQVAMDMPW